MRRLAEHLKFGLSRRSEAFRINLMAETKRTLYHEPIICPLNADGELYAIQDETGNTIGAGTRDMCEVLVAIMKSEDLSFSRLDKRSRPLEEKKGTTYECR